MRIRTGDQVEAGRRAADNVWGVDCVFLTCFDHNASFFAAMLSSGGIRLHRACTAEMADFLLLATGATVLVLDTTFLDGSWEYALAMTRRLHPLVSVLVCADRVDTEFIASAREKGVFEVLWLPISLERLRSIIWAAHTATLERRLWLAERETFVQAHVCLAKKE